MHLRHILISLYIWSNSIEMSVILPLCIFSLKLCHYLCHGMDKFTVSCDSLLQFMLTASPHLNMNHFPLQLPVALSHWCPHSAGCGKKCLHLYKNISIQDIYCKTWTQCARYSYNISKQTIGLFHIGFRML
jgi:hypothetical protein